MKSFDQGQLDGVEKNLNRGRIGIARDHLLTLKPHPEDSLFLPYATLCFRAGLHNHVQHLVFPYIDSSVQLKLVYSGTLVAKAAYQSALAALKGTTESPMTATLLFEIGNIHSLTHDFTAAELAFSKLANFCDEPHSALAFSAAVNLQGARCFQPSKRQEAMDSLNSLLQSVSIRKYRGAQAGCHYFLSQSFLMERDFAKARFHLQACRNSLQADRRRENLMLSLLSAEVFMRSQKMCSSSAATSLMRKLRREVMKQNHPVYWDWFVLIEALVALTLGDRNKAKKKFLTLLLAQRQNHFHNQALVGLETLLGHSLVDSIGFSVPGFHMTLKTLGYSYLSYNKQKFCFNDEMLQRLPAKLIWTLLCQSGFCLTQENLLELVWQDRFIPIHSPAKVQQTLRRARNILQGQFVCLTSKDGRIKASLQKNVRGQIHLNLPNLCGDSRKSSFG